MVNNINMLIFNKFNNKRVFFEELFKYNVSVLLSVARTLDLDLPLLLPHANLATSFHLFIFLLFSSLLCYIPLLMKYVLSDTFWALL